MKKKFFILLPAMLSLMLMFQYKPATASAQEKTKDEESKAVLDKAYKLKEFRDDKVTQIFIPALTAKEVDRLKPEVLALYDKALDYFDKVNEDAALECLKSAVLIQPEVVKFHMSIFNIYMKKARVAIGDASIENYSLAEKSIENIINIPDLRESDMQTAQGLLKQVKKEREEVPVRDERRRDLNQRIVEEHIKNYFGEEYYNEQKEKPTKTKEVNKTLPGIFGAQASNTATATGGGSVQPLPPMTGQDQAAQANAQPGAVAATQPAGDSPFAVQNAAPQAQPEQQPQGQAPAVAPEQNQPPATGQTGSPFEAQPQAQPANPIAQ